MVWSTHSISLSGFNSESEWFLFCLCLFVCLSLFFVVACVRANCRYFDVYLGQMCLQSRGDGTHAEENRDSL